MTDLFNQVRRFLEPRSVAMVGASTRTGPESFNALESLLARGYRGRIYAVNPKGGEILGVKVYPRVADLPEVVDLAVIATPREAVPALVKECVEKGIRAVTIITQGFADADAAGKKMQEEIAALIRGTATRVAGPNTLGMANAFAGFYTAFIGFTNRPAANGVICQSGIFLAGAMDFTAGVGLGIDLGNMVDLDFADVLEYFALEDRVKVINLHIEGLKDGRRFMEAARRVSRAKPVLCLKTARSAAGARAAGSHSGSLAGADHVLNAAFRQAGVIRVDNVGEMNDLNKTFLTYPPPAGRRVAVITITGGGGIATVDACARYGLELARFSPATEQALAAVYPSWLEVGNPADIWPAGMSRGYRPITSLALQKIMNDPQVDAVICITSAYLPPADDPLDISGLFKEAARSRPDKPLAIWVFGPHRRACGEKVEEEGTIVVYPSPERAVRALDALYDYHHRIKKASRPQAPRSASAGHDRAAAIIRRAGKEGVLLGQDALDLIGTCGIRTVASRPAASQEEALERAAEMGFPLVMKLNSLDVAHKSDVGGVKINLQTPAEVAAAYAEIMRSAAARAPGARITGVLLQPFRTGGCEVILGARRDPQFGPVLVYGLGGIYTELFRDVSFRVAPVSQEEALAMIAETKSYQSLRGMRGQAPADLNALAAAVAGLSWLVTSFPEIAELDINPLLVGPDGVLALDARVILG